MISDTILQLGTVLVSFGIISTPILYPKYSIFVYRANVGIRQLNSVRTKKDDIELRYVEEGETGFKELIEVVDLLFGIKGDAERLCLAVGSPPALGEFTGFGMEFGIGDNAVLYVETDNENRELLLWEPHSPTRTLQLEKVRAGIGLRAKERSHHVTITLAVLWTTLSIMTIFG